jgi:Xaa-Pro aminopeptidase
MKTDINAILSEHNLDAMLISGPAQHNPAMYYFTGGVHMKGDLIVRRGQEPVLFCRPMERDEAASSGIATRLLTDYPYDDLLKQYHGDVIQATAALYKQMMVDVGVTSGRVALYGRSEIGTAYAIFAALQAMAPELILVGEQDNSALLQVRETKDENEVARIRRVGQATTSVVAMVSEFLASHTVRNEVLVRRDGEPVTIGDIKQRIALWLAGKDCEDPEGVIFAIGRDAGVPHSSGKASDVLRLGQTIVFDIFPCEKGGGYFYDFTRTWSLGYATDEALQLYETVRQVYQQIMQELAVGQTCRTYQLRTCELFEAAGHATILNKPGLTSGYVHSLGHGLGLQVHERPWFKGQAENQDMLRPGHVFTVEPGLYYPERGMGVRLEDTVWVRPDGQMEVLAPYPLDFVLPIHG